MSSHRLIWEGRRKLGMSEQQFADAVGVRLSPRCYIFYPPCTDDRKRHLTGLIHYC